MTTPDLADMIARWRAMAKMAAASDKNDPAAIELTLILDAAEVGMRAKDAVAWASGEDPAGYPEFQARGDGDPPYWWRKTMRQIADGTIRRATLTLDPPKPKRRKA